MSAVKEVPSVYTGKQSDDIIGALVSKYITAVKDNANFSFFLAV